MECNHTSVSSRLLQLLWYIGGTPPVLREPRYKTKHSHSIQDCTKSNPKNTNITEVNSKLTLIKSNIEVSEPTQRRSSMPSGRSFKPSLILLALCVIVSPSPVAGRAASPGRRRWPALTWWWWPPWSRAPGRSRAATVQPSTRSQYYM